MDLKLWIWCLYYLLKLNLHCVRNFTWRMHSSLKTCFLFIFCWFAPGWLVLWFLKRTGVWANWFSVGWESITGCFVHFELQRVAPSYSHLYHQQVSICRTAACWILFVFRTILSKRSAGENPGDQQFQIYSNQLRPTYKATVSVTEITLWHILEVNTGFLGSCMNKQACWWVCMFLMRYLVN